jgi:archaetidylinositol phosphate synthase
LLTRLRKEVEAALTLLAKSFHSLGLNPFSLSLLGLVCAFLSGTLYYTLAIWPWISWVAPILLLLSGLFDALDGAMARVYGQVTKFGGVIDSVFDRIGEVFVYCGIILGGFSSIFWGLVALVASLMVSYIRSRAEAAGAKMEGVGIAERPERIVILAVATFIGQIELGLIVIGCLATLTLFHRVWRARVELS